MIPLYAAGQGQGKVVPTQRTAEAKPVVFSWEHFLPLPPAREHLLLSESICGCHIWGGVKNDTGTSGLKPKILINLLQGAEQPSSKVLVNVRGATFEKPCPKLCRSELACHVQNSQGALFMAVIY